MEHFDVDMAKVLLSQIKAEAQHVLSTVYDLEANLIGCLYNLNIEKDNEQYKNLLLETLKNIYEIYDAFIDVEADS